MHFTTTEQLKGSVQRTEYVPQSWNGENHS